MSHELENYAMIMSEVISRTEKSSIQHWGSLFSKHRGRRSLSLGFENYATVMSDDQ